jgi:hypothetical protein
MRYDEMRISLFNVSTHLLFHKFHKNARSYWCWKLTSIFAVAGNDWTQSFGFDSSVLGSFWLYPHTKSELRDVFGTNRGLAVFWIAHHRMNGSSCEVEVPRPKFTPKHSFDSSVFPHCNFKIWFDERIVNFQLLHTISFSRNENDQIK